MKSDYIQEVAITIDFDDGICYLDTTVKRIASRALECGMKETTPEGGGKHGGYRRFQGVPGNISIRSAARARKDKQIDEKLGSFSTAGGKKGRFGKAKVGPGSGKADGEGR